MFSLEERVQIVVHFCVDTLSQVVELVSIHCGFDKEKIAKSWPTG